MTDDLGTFRTDIELENPERPGDLGLLGARTLEGLNVVVDPARRASAGDPAPAPTAAAGDEHVATQLAVNRTVRLAGPDP